VRRLLLSPAHGQLILEVAAEGVSLMAGICNCSVGE